MFCSETMLFFTFVDQDFQYILTVYAIPKINMLCNLMLFENEVKAAVR